MPQWSADRDTGVPVTVAVLDEKDPVAVTAWLSPLVRALGVKVMGTDDLSSYRRVAEELGV